MEIIVTVTLDDMQVKLHDVETISNAISSKVAEAMHSFKDGRNMSVAQTLDYEIQIEEHYGETKQCASNADQS